MALSSVSCSISGQYVYRISLMSLHMGLNLTRRTTGGCGCCFVVVLGELSVVVEGILSNDTCNFLRFVASFNEFVFICNKFECIPLCVCEEVS